MENRLSLNNKPRYELPDGTEVARYDFNKKVKSIIPNFEPDLCLTAWGTPLGRILKGVKKLVKYGLRQTIKI